MTKVPPESERIRQNFLKRQTRSHTTTPTTPPTCCAPSIPNSRTRNSTNRPNPTTTIDTKMHPARRTSASCSSEPTRPPQPARERRPTSLSISKYRVPGTCLSCRKKISGPTIAVVTDVKEDNQAARAYPQHESCQSATLRDVTVQRLAHAPENGPPCRPWTTKRSRSTT